MGCTVPPDNPTAVPSRTCMQCAVGGFTRAACSAALIRSSRTACARTFVAVRANIGVPVAVGVHTLASFLSVVVTLIFLAAVCDSACTACTGAANGQCTACMTGYTLINGFCLSELCRRRVLKRTADCCRVCFSIDQCSTATG